MGGEKTLFLSKFFPIIHFVCVCSFIFVCGFGFGVFCFVNTGSLGLIRYSDIFCFPPLSVVLIANTVYLIVFNKFSLPSSSFSA